MMMLRSSCALLCKGTCSIATKSPFSKSKPLHTRPYAPFLISCPSIFQSITRKINLKIQYTYIYPILHRPKFK